DPGVRHRLHQVGPGHLPAVGDELGDPAVQQVTALHRGLLRAVGGGHRSLLVVPVDVVVLVDRVRVLLEGGVLRGVVGRVPAAPLVRRVRDDRHSRVHERAAHHVGTGVEVGGVVGVDVEPVEGVVDVVRGALEVLRRADRVGVVELLEPDDGVHFVQEGGARGGVGDGLAVDGGAVGHRPVVGAVGDQPVGAAGGVVAQVG